MNTVPTLEGVPTIPADEQGPVFREPWEAQIFALVVRLHQQELFTWKEWADALSGEIRNAQTRGDPDLGDTYYQHWLNTLETLVITKGIASAELIHDREQEIALRPTGRHEHVARREPVKVC